MKFERYKCDRCNKETDDYIKDKWILTGHFIKYSGRTNDGVAMTDYYISNDKHFCSWVCFNPKDFK